MMRIGWNSEKKKVGIGRLIDWLVGIPSLLEFRQKFRHCWNSVIAREQSRGSNLVKNSVIKQHHARLNKMRLLRFARNDEF